MRDIQRHGSEQSPETTPEAATEGPQGARQTAGGARDPQASDRPSGGRTESRTHTEPKENSMPTRIQRRRTAGWRAPLDTQGRRPIYVGRGSRFGNPFWILPTVGGFAVNFNGGAGVATFTKSDARRYAADAYREYLTNVPFLAEAVRKELTGRDLMCWCPLPEPGQPDHCHAAVLIELANKPTP